MAEKKPTAKTEILRVLGEARSPLAAHEIRDRIQNYNENNIATRLPELALAGLVVGTKRPGKNFKEWSLVRAGQAELPLERPMAPPEDFDYGAASGAPAF